MKINMALDNLAMTLEESLVYKNYKHVLEQVEKNKDINNAVKNIKSIQKKLVKEKYVNGKNAPVLENNLEENKAYLYNIPLYQDYISSSEELNNLVNIVNEKLQTCLDGLNI